MSRQSNQTEITRYLLGSLSDEEKALLEERYFSDDAMFEEIEIAEEELIDRYVRGELSNEDSERFAAVVADSPRLAERVEFARVWKDKLAVSAAPVGNVQKPLEPKEGWGKAAQPRSRSVSMRYLAIAASVVVLIGVGFFVWRTFTYEPPIERGLEALQAAYAQQRPVEVRLSTFNYAPLPNQRGAVPPVNTVKRDLAAGLLLTEVSENPNARSRHAVGQYHLYVNQFSQAIAELEAALASDPNNAQIHSDLGAALLEQGKTSYLPSSDGKAIDAFAKALPHLNKALELDSKRLEALFNRALLYDYLGLPREAEADWRRYLQLDPNSQWSEEARQYLRTVEEKIKNISKSTESIFQDFVLSYDKRDDDQSWQLFSSSHNRMGNVVVEHLLDAYLTHTVNEQPSQANRDMEMLAYAAALAKNRTGDGFYADVAAVYQRMNPKQRANLLQARTVLKTAYTGWGQISPEENLELFRTAKQLFVSAGAVAESYVADYWIAFCHYRRHRNDESLAALPSVISKSKEANYKQLLARCWYLLSAIYFNRNEHSKALEFGQKSLEMANEISDRVGIINALTSLVEYFRYLGVHDNALRYIEQAVPHVTSISMDPVQGSRHFGFGATAFAAAGLPEAARAFQQEALRFALDTGNTSVISYNYAFLGMINSRLGNVEQALENTQLAYDVAKNHSNNPTDRELMAYALLQRGHVYRQSRDYNHAIINYTGSIDGYENLDYPTNLYQAYKGRFLCYAAQNQNSSAKLDLAKTLKLAEEYRENIPQETVRETFFDTEQGFYDAAIDFEYSRLNEREEAFRLAELSRGRSLLDLIHSESKVLTRLEPEIVSASVSSPLGAKEVVSQLPERAQIVQYSVLENKLVVWVISERGISSVDTVISETELTEKVRTYLKFASSPSLPNPDEVMRYGKHLHHILFEPVEPLLDRQKQLCIVPDKVLSYLPFAALMSSSSGRYLLEDYRLIVSPSSTIFIASSQTARDKNLRKEERLLSVGDPRFDKTAFPTFRDLPAAAEEARRVADYYKSPKVLTGTQAKVETFKSELTKADVAHLALHSALDERFPLRSRFLFAGNGVSDGEAQTQNGVLFAYEIYGLKLPRTRLAVLSACDTGAERYYRGEGMISLARPFIAANVPLVVASLWPVDSDVTQDLMVTFQKVRKVDRFFTVDALRSAQLAMLHSKDERHRQPYYWAPFVVIGGYAEF